jgi:hypothetical protein
VPASSATLLIARKGECRVICVGTVQRTSSSFLPLASTVRSIVHRTFSCRHGRNCLALLDPSQMSLLRSSFIREDRVSSGLEARDSGLEENTIAPKTTRNGHASARFSETRRRSSACVSLNMREAAGERAFASTSSQPQYVVDVQPANC